MRGLWAAQFGLALFGLVLTQGAAAERLDAAGLRDFGARALAQGYAEQALAVAGALIARDGRDAEALVLQAQALRVLGRLEDSEAAGRAAWAAASTPEARYMAATVLAQALSLQGRRILAQYWLRQAVQVAPSAEAAGQAVQDLAYVRGETALRLRYDLALAPSDNVNGGARAESFQLGGVSFPLPAQLTALSGLTWGLGVSGDWRIAGDARGETALTFDLQRSGVVLSQASRDLGGVASNYDFLHLGAGIARRGAAGRELRLDLGQNWYGGEKLSATYGVEAGWQPRLGPGRADLTLGLMREHRMDRAQASSSQLRLEAGWTLAGPRGDRWRVSGHALQALSQDVSVAREEVGLGLTWRAGQSLGGLDLGAQVGVVGARHESGRSEGRLRASLEAEIAQASWLGFAPVLSLTWSRGNSNFFIHDTQSLGLGLTIRSQF